MRTLKLSAFGFMFMTVAISTPSAQQKNSPSHESRPANAAPATAGQGSATEESKTTKLPVRRVVLYKTGVGYFEHVGHVRGNQNVRIDFTSGQLNDVLQSLTILDLNGGRIAGVNYNSEAPLSQRLGTLRLPLEENTNLSKFYAALRGARLKIQSGTISITGRLLSVERKTRVSGGTTLEVDLITLISDSGEVRSVEITPSISVQLAEPDMTQEVGRYLHLLASVRQEDLRRMTIAATGSGERQLYISYISEVPIWKTTYRVVLSSKKSGETLLQGWAIVDNTIGEDWNDIELSLVAGAPQSFIEQLSQPYYGRRPVIPLPQSAQLAPQTHEGALQGGIAGLSGHVQDPSGAVISNAKITLLSDAVGQVASTTTDGQGSYSFGDLPAGNYQLRVEMAGFRTSVVQGLSLGGGRGRTQDVTLQLGSASTTIEITASPATVDTSSSEVSRGRIGSGRELGSGAGAERAGPHPLPAHAGGPVSGLYYLAPGVVGEARQQMSSAAQGADLGDLFEYKLKDRVTIHKNESSLVPIVQAHVAAEKVSLWNPSLSSPRPLRALWLTNSSPLTLDGGSFSVLEDETFAGEGLTDAIKPGEKRLVSYAADLGVRVDSKTESTPQRVTRVSINHGTMKQVSELRQDTTYTIRDDDTTPRVVLIEHPARAEWKLADDGPKPEETTSSVHRFRMNLGPKATVILSVREAKPIETRYELTNLSDDQIRLFLQQKTINPEVEAAFHKIVEQKDRVAALDAEISRREDETQKIYDDQQRLRENMKALKGSAEERSLTQRYTQQLGDQENRLENLKRESAELQTKRGQAQAELDNMIESLALEATL